MSTSKPGNNVAKVHTHQSNRVKRGNPTDPSRKVVFKSAFDTPFRIQWPSVPDNVQNALLAATAALFDGVADYHLNRPSQSRKRKREDKQEKERAAKKQNLGDADEPMPLAAPSSSSTTATTSSAPSVLSHVTIGINQVTKALETQIKAAMKPGAERDLATSSPAISLVLVCRPDVDPPILIDHIPHLVAAFNSISPRVEGQENNLVRLASLPRGSELILAQALGLRRVAVLAVHSNTSVLSTLEPSLQSLPIISAPWLSTPGSLIPTHIKQMKTTTPKDMKAAKEQRAQGRLAAKQKRTGAAKDTGTAKKKR